MSDAGDMHAASDDRVKCRQWTGLLFSKVHAANGASGGHAQGKSRVLTGLANSGRRRRRPQASSPQRTTRNTTLLRRWTQRTILGDGDKINSIGEGPFF